MAIKLDLLEVENIYNKDGEQTLNLTGDQGIVVSGNVTSTVGYIQAYANSDTTPGFRMQSNDNHGWEFLHRATEGDFALNRETGGTTTEALRISRSNGNATFAGSITMPEALKATNNNLKFHAGGTHVFNVDVNKNIYPQTHNSTDLGFSSTLAFRQLWLSGDINTSGELIINNNASNNDKGIHIKNDTDAYGGGITFWTEYGGTDTNVARVQGGTNGSNGILYLQTANTSKVLTTALSLDFNQNAFFANDVTFKNASIVKLKAAPLGSLYGAGFNVMTVTGTSSAPYTSTIGFSNYSATDVLKLEGTNATFAGDVILPALKKLYLDNGSNSYIHESASDVIDVVTGGSTRLTVNSNGISSSSNVYSGTSGQFRNYPGTWKASTGLTGNGFEFINSVDGTALTLSSTGNATFAGDIRNTNSYQTGTVSAANPALKAVLLAHSVESNSVAVHPYLFNDLANFRKRGGTITYGGLSSNPSDAASDIMFQASALTCSISNSVITGSTWTIELKDFPRVLYYGTRFGISFGSVSFAPTSMLIQYSTDNGANYTTALTSSVRNEYYHTYISNGSTAINAVKFTIGKFSTHSPRLMNIYAYNYDSRGMTEYFLDKAGGALYGNLSMHSSGFTLDGNTITGIDDSDEFTDNDNHIMTSAAVDDRITSRISGLGGGSGNGDMLLGTAQDITADKEYQDGIKAKFGNGADLQIYHNGSNDRGYIYKTTGDLYIESASTDGDIKFFADDGASGTTAYLTIDGGDEIVRVHKPLYLTEYIVHIGDDNTKFGFSDADTFVVHAGASGHAELTITGTTATFGGNIILNGDGKLLKFTPSSYDDVELGIDSNGFVIYNTTDARYDLKISGDGNATFAGTITGTTITSTVNSTTGRVRAGVAGQLHLGDDSDIISVGRSNELWSMADVDSDQTLYIHYRGYNNASSRFRSLDIRDGKAGQIALFNGTDKSTTFGGNITTGGHIYLPASKYIYSNNKGLIGATASQTEIYGINNKISFYAEGGGTKYMTVHNGNVAIGTSDPTSLSSNTSSLSIDSTRTDLTGGIFLKANGTTQSQIYWDSTGLNLENLSDNGDITFKSDNGSGGVATYFYLNGGLSSPYTIFPDGTHIGLGNSIDLAIYHDSANSYLSQNGTGNLIIQQAVADADLILRADNGSGSATGYLTLDGTNVRTKFHKNVNLEDNVQLQIGNSQDLKLYHNTSHSYIEQAGVGNLIIQNLVDDSDIIFICDDGSGGTEEYFRLDGSANGGNPLTVFPDGSNLAFGSAPDTYLMHNGTDFILDNYNTGNIHIRNNVNDKDIIFSCDDGSGGVTEYFKLWGLISSILISKDVLIGNDTAKLKFGASQDLEIYHDGSNSYIKGTVQANDLIIQNEHVAIKSHSNENMIHCDGDSSVQLYYNGNSKIATVNAGVKTSYAATSNTDGDAAGDIVYFGNTTVSAGLIYYYTSSGQWELADADAESTAKGLLGVALAENSGDGMLIRGMVTLNHDPGTRGDTLFLSATAGRATSTAPSGSGDIVRVLGYCLDSTNGQVYFNPDGAFVEVTAGG